MNIMEMIKLVQGKARSESEQLQSLAMLGPPPGEDFKPQIKLPVMNDVPAFNLGRPGLGSVVAGKEYGVAAPVPDQPITMPPSLGQMLIGETDGNL